MSLVTRCPACGTAFKVVKDQLRISEGWVRCGRCSGVFDATLELHETLETRPASSATATAPPGKAATSATSPVPGAASALHEQEAESAAKQHAQDIGKAGVVDDEHAPKACSAKPPDVVAPAPEAPLKIELPSKKSDALLFGGLVADEPWPDTPNVDADRHVIPRYPSFPPFPHIDSNLKAAPPLGREARPAEEVEAANAQASTAGDVADVQLQKALRRARAKSAKIARAKARGEERAARESVPAVLAASESATMPDSLSPPPQPRFAAAAVKGAELWRRMDMRRALAVVAVLAAIVLAMQVLHHERDQIAARQPSLRPLLAALCGLTGCELSAPMQIGDITIDGASFAREKSGDAYRLNFTLRNAAPMPLAMPAVELSLLDTQERAVVRRVLMPAEFGAPPVLPARAERAASLSLALSGPEAAALPPVAGFHLLAFYP